MDRNLPPGPWKAVKGSCYAEEYAFRVVTDWPKGSIREHARNHTIAQSVLRQDIALAIAALPHLIAALEQIIEMNRAHALHEFGSEEKAEGWACVRVARAALRAVKEGGGHGR